MSLLPASTVYLGEQKPLSENRKLTVRAQGNLLLRIDGQANPTQTLMTAIQQRDAGKLGDKDEAFFLRIEEKVVRILSGDPSRGALSLDMEDPLREGQRVQVSHCNAPANGSSCIAPTNDLLFYNLESILAPCLDQTMRNRQFLAGNPESKSASLV